MVSEQAIEELLAPVREGFVAIREGQWNREQWQAVANAMNIAEALAKDGIGPNLMDAIAAAQYGLRMLARRFHEAGTKAAYGVELGLIAEGIDILTAQMQQSTNGDLKKACETAARYDIPGSTKT